MDTLPRGDDDHGVVGLISADERVIGIHDVAHLTGDRAEHFGRWGSVDYQHRHAPERGLFPLDTVKIL
jgi:hypothetical protein